MVQRRERVLQQPKSQRLNVRAIRQAREQQLQSARDIREVAQKIDKQLKSGSFTSKKEFEQELNQIPDEIRRQMTVNPQFYQQKQNEVISNLEIRKKRIERNIKKTRDRERNARTDSQRDRLRADEDRYRGELRGINEGIKEIKKGSLLQENQIIQYARDVGRNEKQRSLQQQSKKQVQKDVAKQIAEGKGNVTQISYDSKGLPKQVTVDGQKVNLSNLSEKDRIGIQLTAVKQAKGQERQKAIQNIANQNLDIKQLKDKGFSMSEIAQVGRIELQDSIIKGAEGRKFNDRELKLLGFSDNEIKKVKNTDLKIGDLKQAGLSMNQISRIGSVQLRNEILKTVEPINRAENIRKVLGEQGKYIAAIFEPTLTPPTKVQQKFDFPINKALEQFEKGTKASRDYMRTQYSLAQKGDKRSIQALKGFGLLLTTGADITVNFASAIVQSLQTLNSPEDMAIVQRNTANYLKSLDKEKIKQIQSDLALGSVAFSQRLARGNPEAAAEVAIVFTPTGIPKRADKFVQKFVDEATDVAVSNTKFNIKQNLLKGGSGTFKFSSTGITKQNKPFTLQGNLTMQPKQKSLRGDVISIVGGKKSTIKVNLVDEGTFFIDKKTGITIPKLNKKLDDVQVNVVQLKDNIKSKEALTNRIVDGELTQGKRVRERLRGLATQSTKAETRSVQDVKFEKFIGLKDNRRYKQFIEKESLRKPLKTIYSKPQSKRTVGDWDSLVRFLEFMQYDKKIIAGLDKRGWKARLLGLNKNDNVLKRFDKDFKDGFVIQTANSRATGSYETINPQKFRLGPSFLFANPTPKIINKLKKEKGKVKTPLSVKIPDTNVFLKLPKNLPKGVQIPKKFLKVAVRLGLAQNYKFKGVTQIQKQRFINSFKKLQERKQETQQIKKPLRKTVQKKLTKTQLKLTQKLKGKQTLKKMPLKLKSPILPKLPTRPPKKPKRIVLPKPSVKSNKRIVKDTKLGEISLVFRDSKTGRRRVQNYKTGLPLLEAKKVAKDIVDSTLLASFTVKPYGKTEKRLSVKKVDTKKFTVRKGKDPKVRNLVEKPKFRLDKKGETKQISQARIKKLTEDRIKKVKEELKKQQKKVLKPKKKKKVKKVKKHKTIRGKKK